MCGRRLKIFSALSVLCFLSFCSPLCSFCYADVVLSDQEAVSLLNEIQESRKDLNQVKEELTESKKESQELKTELQTVKNTYSEQKKSYEMQLTEAEKQNERLKTSVTVTGTSSVIFFVLMIVFIIV